MDQPPTRRRVRPWASRGREAVVRKRIAQALRRLADKIDGLVRASEERKYQIPYRSPEKAGT
jgi:hypothetical protein